MLPVCVNKSASQIVLYLICVYFNLSLQEFADALKDLGGENADQLVNAEQAAQAAQELEEVRSRLEKDRLASEEKLKKEKEGEENVEAVS